MAYQSGHSVGSLSPRIKELCSTFAGRTPSIVLEPGNWLFLEPYKRYADDFYNFQFEESDVVVHSFPKSGTTWTQEIVWTMRNSPNLDNPLAELPLNIRTPIIEADFILTQDRIPVTFKDMFAKQFPGIDQSHGPFLHMVKVMPKPRTIKSHLGFPLLSPSILEKGKVVYVLRDPRDVCLSYHHHCRVFDYDGFTGTIDQFVDAFLEGAVIWGPYWEHVKQAWKLRNHPNMHIVSYEGFKKNTKVEYQKLDKFLGTKLTDEQLDKIIHHSSFEQMKKRDNHVISATDAPDYMNMAMVKAEGGFFRKGTAGGWKKVLTQEQQDKFAAWIDKNCPDKEIMKLVEL